jgi:RNA polymerase sigma-70 factor (ECF subfamily)
MEGVATFAVLMHLNSINAQLTESVNTTPLSEILDEELVLQFRNGNLHSGSLLYSRYKNGIYSFCLRMLQDSEGAKDATQDTFLKMVTNIQSLNNGTAFKAWLFSVARNEVLMVVRRKKIVPMEQFDDETIVFDHSTPLSITMQSEMREKIQKSMLRLKPAYREAYMLREIEGFSYEEIAAATGTTISAVKSKLFKSRVALNEMLASYR